ncbi:MAG: hypothetical protein H3C54_04240 [Taibaiella sp.]|nr:hypothetical protein [Taibaiella sp.]
MKKLIFILSLVIISGTSSCSSTRDTKKADPRAQQYIPERHKNQDEDANAPGHQKDEIREEHMK